MDILHLAIMGAELDALRGAQRVLSDVCMVVVSLASLEISWKQGDADALVALLGNFRLHLAGYCFEVVTSPQDLDLAVADRTTLESSTMFAVSPACASMQTHVDALARHCCSRKNCRCAPT